MLQHGTQEVGVALQGHCSRNVAPVGDIVCLDVGVGLFNSHRTRRQIHDHVFQEKDHSVVGILDLFRLRSAKDQIQKNLEGRPWWWISEPVGSTVQNKENWESQRVTESDITAQAKTLLLLLLLVFAASAPATATTRSAVPAQRKRRGDVRAEMHRVTRVLGGKRAKQPERSTRYHRDKMQKSNFINQPNSKKQAK